MKDEEERKRERQSGERERERGRKGRRQFESLTYSLIDRKKRRVGKWNKQLL